MSNEEKTGDGTSSRSGGVSVSTTLSVIVAAIASILFLFHFF